MLAELGHTTDFWSYEPKASTRLMNTFLDSGKVDDSLYTPATVDFTPEVTQTALAKGIAGTMIGLALIAVLSLLLMARRVRRRGGFGRKASAVLRSLYPLVLGLGGWFIGVLIVLTAFPTVPLDDELLAVLSIGMPIGLGIYWAWVNRDWSARAKTVGLRGGSGGRARRRLAGVPRSDRAPGARHDDRRSGRRREPDAARPRHRPGIGRPAIASSRPTRKRHWTRAPRSAEGQQAGRRRSGGLPVMASRLGNPADVEDATSLYRQVIEIDNRTEAIMEAAITSATPRYGYAPQVMFAATLAGAERRARERAAAVASDRRQARSARHLISRLATRLATSS